MKKDEALEMAFDELGDVQFCDNDWRAAKREEAEVKKILRRLAERLTKRAADGAGHGAHVEFAKKFVGKSEGLQQPRR
jgi:hypothetical protein